MDKDCPDCAAWRSKKVKYCASCGKDLSKPSEREHPLFHLITWLAVLTVIAVVLINTIYGIVHFNQICKESMEYSYSASISFGLTDVTLFKITGNGVKILFTLLLATDSLVLGYGVYRFLTPFLKEIKDESVMETEKTGTSAAACYLCVSLFLSIAYFLIMGIFGEIPDTDWMNDYTDNQMMFMLTRAGIREELMMRVFWIGLPMAVLALIIRKDNRCYQYLFGGFGMSKVAIVFIALSAIIFGLAHNDGWGWVKVGDALMAGVLFGYLYVEYGLYAAILAHTANDVLTTVGLTALGEGTMLMMELGLIGMGLILLIYWIIKPNLELLDIKKMKLFPEKLEMNLLDQWKRH